MTSGLRRSAQPVRRMATQMSPEVSRASRPRSPHPSVERPLTLVWSQEELSMQKLYPGFRTSWFGNPGQYQTTWGDAKNKWFIVEAYPLYAAIGLGCGVCFLHCMRHMFFSPDVSALCSACFKRLVRSAGPLSQVMVSKSNRANAMLDNTRAVRAHPD